MDEQQFDKDLKNLLENSPPFEPSEQALEDMKARLDQAYGCKRWWIPWWWWVPLLVLPFAGGMIYFLIKFQTLNNQLNAISLQLKNQQLDTTTHHYTLYHYDTVYTKVIIRKRGEEPLITPNYRTTDSPWWSANWKLQNPFTAAVPSFSLHPNRPEWSTRLMDQIKNGRLLLADLRQPLSNLENKEKEIDTRSWLPMDLINGPGSSYLREYSFANEKIQSAFFFQTPQTRPLRRPLLQGAQLGAFVGAVALVDSPNAFIWEANLDLVLSRRWRVRTGFQQMKIEFEEKEEDHFDEHPLVAPDSPGDELEEIKANYTVARIPVRFIYTFSSQKTIQPYLGVGISGVKSIRPELMYEFRGSSGEYYKTLVFDTPNISLKNLEFVAGLELYLGRGVNLSLEGFRFQNFDRDIEMINRLSHFGGKVGLHYGF